MDWQALRISAWLALLTAAVLLLPAIALARWLAAGRSPGRTVVEASLALPLILPPTVLGFYLLVAMGAGSPLGAAYASLFGHPLAFSFSGLLVASVVFNIPFAVMPMQRAFAAIPAEVADAARTCGLSRWRSLWRIELPLAWPGILTGVIMTAAHTLGEFGVVLMVGGNIPGETRTVAIAIYDRAQAFDLQGAGAMSAMLLAISMATLLVGGWLGRSRNQAGARVA
ncbi:MAG: molybdate ABC transporter permease subunit [Pseudomonadota bacterium]